MSGRARNMVRKPRPKQCAAPRIEPTTQYQEYRFGACRSLSSSASAPSVVQNSTTADSSVTSESDTSCKTTQKCPNHPENEHTTQRKCKTNFSTCNRRTTKADTGTFISTRPKSQSSLATTMLPHSHTDMIKETSSFQEVPHKEHSGQDHQDENQGKRMSIDINFSSQKETKRDSQSERTLNESVADDHQIKQVATLVGLCSESSTSTSSGEEFSCRYRTKLVHPKSRKPLNFTKYIPVPIPMPAELPKLLLNKMDPKEWEDAQNAYLQSRVRHLRSSASDTSSIGKTDPELLTSPKKSVSCAPLRFSRDKKTKVRNTQRDILDTKSDIKENERLLEHFQSTCMSFDAHKSKLDNRFDHDLEKYEKLIQNNVAHVPSLSAVLYCALSENPNYNLCHVMTELTVSAMLNFLHPYQDVQCMWVTDLRNTLINLLSDHSLKPRFNRLVYLRKFEAILVLSEDANALVLRRDTCFLHSLTSALKIKPHKLLVLAKEKDLRHVTA